MNDLREEGSQSSPPKPRPGRTPGHTMVAEVKERTSVDLLTHSAAKGARDRREVGVTWVFQNHTPKTRVPRGEGTFHLSPPGLQDDREMGRLAELSGSSTPPSRVSVQPRWVGGPGDCPKPEEGPGAVDPCLAVGKEKGHRRKSYSHIRVAPYARTRVHVCAHTETHTLLIKPYPLGCSLPPPGPFPTHLPSHACLYLPPGPGEVCVTSHSCSGSSGCTSGLA